MSGELPSGVVFVALTREGVLLARRLAKQFPAASVHALQRYGEGADETFSETGAHIRGLFSAGTPIVGICSAGILVRALAPVLADKRGEPPVVAVSEDGNVVVPLLGGHRGANRISRTIAEITGGTAAVTTAGDVALGLALDDPPSGWRVANVDAAKGIAARLLNGTPVGLRVDAGDAAWIERSGAAFVAGATPAVIATHRHIAEPGEDFILHPPVLALGVGCERGIDAGEMIQLSESVLARHGLASGAVACVVSIDVKADEEAVHGLARRLDVPARFFSAADLEKESPRLANPSDTVFREVGCHGVAEGAALAAVGSAGRLLVEKTVAGRATCAVALLPGGIDPARVGRARGHLAVVGLGPGAPAWRTPEATRLIAVATDVVGLQLYLDLLGDALAGKQVHASLLAEEEARVRKAISLAAEGKSVALVSSGDPGIYALATLVFEVLEHENRPEWNRIAVQVAPGVSALQAAAARVGAPLGHDFAAISLSDLLTPWEEIERRLRAAAAGNFVLALYNPVSKRRRTQLGRARDILLQARPAATPVVLARNLGREGEDVRTIRLDELDADKADMLTVILIGNRETRAIASGVNRWVYTPRGYARKAGSS
ncbi:MAG: precorrin-3B C(17)-methyltransferase [Rhodospirillales bacterium]|nr:precorrin-3B C(17)-methyltransferase [Rhodospirillales bacterium]